MKKTVLAVLLMLGLMFTQQAWAIVLDFGMQPPHPQTATIDYNGGATPLVGSGVSVINVSNLGDGPTVIRNILGGALNFTTGGYTGGDASNWFFAPGGSIAVTGGVDFNNNGVIDAGEIPLGTTLLSGSFTGTPKVVYFGGYYNIFGATFDDLKDQDFAEFYGLNADGLGYGWSGGINLSFYATGTPGYALHSTEILSGDITNRPKVPEPTSTTLLSIGLLGFVGGVVRRKFKK